MNTKQLLSALALFILTMACTSDEQVMTGTINGFVSDYGDANHALAGVTLTLSHLGLTKTTGSDGRYEFGELEPGSYSIAASANGYQATTKQITVYAGQVVTCDFQLSKVSTGNSIEFSTRNLHFGPSVNELTVAVENNGNTPLQFSLANVPDFAEASPTAGIIAAKGNTIISVKIKSRTTITETKNGQIILNIGDNAYAIALTVEPYKNEVTNVDITPQNLVFDKNTSQLSFTITNNNTYSQRYDISCSLDVLTISPASGTISSGNKNTVSVSVKDRKSITEDLNGQITISIGENLYYIFVTVENNETTNVDISPQNLVFDQNTSQLSFSITNNNTYSQSYNISSSLDVLTVSPVSGTISAGNKNIVNVSVKDRNNITENLNGQIAISMGENIYYVFVTVEKAESGDNGSDNSGVTRGLIAHYTFDHNSAEDACGNYDGGLTGGTFITDTPDKKGYALSLKKGENVVIGENPLYRTKNYTICMWVKDYSTGTLLNTDDGMLSYGPTMYITSNNTLQFCSGPSNSNVFTSLAPASLTSSGSWTMITVVVTEQSSYSTEGSATIYVNGVAMKSGKIYYDKSSGDSGTQMTIGGFYIMNYSFNGNRYMEAGPMKIDNVRIYSTTLTKDEIKTIYNSEKP